ncbi:MULTISPECIES: DUF1016 N-terminal domain-containing protein [unclassified Isoptericola]|uniref:DUF1016 N-terminal domain-containing protein n=1 Tax=unclassified Isoptericola TaxID=2623355 RepID=UPI0036572137
MDTDGAALEPSGYTDLLTELKQRVRATQLRAARAANTEVLRLYWSIGRDILERQEQADWGAKVVTRLAADLKREFPDQRGWSRRNLLYMRRAAEVWPTEAEFVQQAVAQLPWGHVTVLLDRLHTRELRDWYAERAVADGWSATSSSTTSRRTCAGRSARPRRTSRRPWTARTPTWPSSSSRTHTSSSTSRTSRRRGSGTSSRR